MLSDNAHITQTRLILLDAALVFFMALTLFSYVKFRKYRYLFVFIQFDDSNRTFIFFFFDSEYSAEWWTWLLATGFFLACTLGCKMVGLFTFFTIGAAVIADLWDILDYKKGLNMVKTIPLSSLLLSHSPS